MIVEGKLCWREVDDDDFLGDHSRFTTSNSFALSAKPSEGVEAFSPSYGMVGQSSPRPPKIHNS